MSKSLRSLIGADSIHLDVPATCKRSVLEKLADITAERYGLDATDVLNRLIDREQLGSTGVGGGVAIPHARLDVEAVTGVLLRLATPVAFEAIDGEPVDLVFLLVAPEADNANHLKALSRVARTFRLPGVTNVLRGAESAEAAYAALLTNADARAA